MFMINTTTSVRIWLKFHRFWVVISGGKWCSSMTSPSTTLSPTMDSRVAYIFICETWQEIGQLYWTFFYSLLEVLYHNQQGSSPIGIHRWFSCIRCHWRWILPDYVELCVAVVASRKSIHLHQCTMRKPGHLGKIQLHFGSPPKIRWSVIWLGFRSPAVCCM